MSLIVYADFTSPECYLAERRCDVLAEAGIPVDFRAIEHRPRLPVSGVRASLADQDALTERFAALQELLLPREQLRWDMPPLLPKSEAAVSAYAAVSDTGVAGEIRRLLFELYWRQGLDIGNPNVLRTPLAGPVLRSGSTADALRESGFVVSVDRGPITTDAHDRVRTWRAEWQHLGSPALPVVLVEGATLHGVDALRRLGKEILCASADVDADLPDPRRYPSERVKPSPFWVSWVGGRWRNSYRLDVTGPSPRA